MPKLPAYLCHRQQPRNPGQNFRQFRTRRCIRVCLILRLLNPARRVIALLRHLVKKRDHFGASRLHKQLQRKAVEQFNSRANHLRICHFIPPSVWPDDVKDHPLHLEAIVRAKHIVKKLRAELIESVPAPVVCNGMHEKTAVFADHFHAVLPRDGEIENVFERAAS